MIELESGTMELDDDKWEHLRRLLEIILPYWVGCTTLNGTWIQIFLLQNSEEACFGKGKFPPVVVIRALRERGGDPEQMAGYVQFDEMRVGVHPDCITQRLQKIFEDTKKMKLLWEDEEQYTQPDANLGQGDGCFRSYRVVFSAGYYNTFLRLHLSHCYTPA